MSTLALQHLDRAAVVAEARATLGLALPMIGTQLAFMALVTTGVLMLGRVGPDALAAAAIGGSFLQIFMIPCFGIVSSTAAIAAQARGRNPRDTHVARRTVRMALWASILLAIPIAVTGWFSEPLLVAAGQSPALARDASHYAQALIPGLPFAFALNAMRSYAGARGRPRPALYIVTAAIGVNALLNDMLIFGRFGLPALGVVGAGLATACVNMFSAAAMAVVLLREPVLAAPKPFANILRPDWRAFRALIRIGLPAGLTSALEVAMFAVAALLMGRIGTDAAAGHNVALNLTAIVFMVPLGLGLAATVRVGYGAGARDHESARRAGWVAIGMAIGFALLCVALFVALPEWLIGLYLDPAVPASRAAFDLAVSFLHVAALFLVVDAIQVVTAGALRGLTDTTIPMLLAAFSYWVIGFPSCWLYAFGFGLGGIGVWFGLATGLLVGATLLTTRFWLKTR